jgi:hypothetical protein
MHNKLQRQTILLIQHGTTIDSRLVSLKRQDDLVSSSIVMKLSNQKYCEVDKSSSGTWAHASWFSRREKNLKKKLVSVYQNGHSELSAFKTPTLLSTATKVQDPIRRLIC